MGIMGDIFGPLHDLIEPTEGLGARMVRNKLREMFYDIAVLASDVLLRQMLAAFTRRV